MCGRYAASKDPATLAREFDAIDDTEGQAPGADYNVAPTKNVLTVVEFPPTESGGRAHPEDSSGPTRVIRIMRWGLVPFWAKDTSVGNRMINTRAETVQEKPAFRKAFSRRRCLVPADGWFEWRAAGADGGVARKKPFFMTDPEGLSLAFAGIWETWSDPDADPDTPPLVTCSILTTDAVGRFADVHSRMPLIMPRERWQAWLDPDRPDAGGLLEPPDPTSLDPLEIRPVSTRVNHVRNNGPELLERSDPEPQDLNALFDLPQS